MERLATAFVLLVTVTLLAGPAVSVRQRGFRAAVRPASTSAKLNIPREKPEEWPPCLLHKLNNSSVL